jgi:hypothetical protein
MTKRKAIVLGLFTIWPIIYMFLIIFLSNAFFESIEFAKEHGAKPPLITYAYIPLHFFTVIDIFSLIVIYIVYTFRSGLIREKIQVLWVVLLVFGAPFSECIFWYLYVWKSIKGDS